MHSIWLTDVSTIKHASQKPLTHYRTKVVILSGGDELESRTNAQF